MDRVMPVLFTWSYLGLHVTRLQLDKYLYSSNKNVWCGLNTETVVCFDGFKDYFINANYNINCKAI